MRIGIAGSFGTGKTDIATEISSRYGLPLIKDSAKNLARAWGIEDSLDLIGDNVNAKQFQFALLMSQLYQKRQKKAFVADITTFDFLAHWSLYGLDDGSSSDEMYRKICSQKLYDLVIYSSLEGIPDDDNDIIIASLKQKIDEETRKALDSNPSVEVVIVDGTIGQRIEKALNAVERFREEIGCSEKSIIEELLW